MSVCGQTEEESASEDPGPAAREVYDQKAVSKVVRVLTVLAYLLSVSLAAILLSVYYVCVWKSPELPPINSTGDGEVAAQRADCADTTTYPYNGTHSPQYSTGGGSISVNDSLSQPANIGNGSSSTSAPVQSTEATEGTESPHVQSSSRADDTATDSMRADNSSAT